MSDTGESTAPPEEKAASSSPDERETANLRLMSGSSLFDAQWYSDRYPEAADSGLEPALHYLRSGAAKGFAPSAGFDGAGYLARYADIARTGMNPLLHFLSFGRAEGRVVNGLPTAPEPPSPHAPPPAAAPSAPDPAAAREAANARIIRDSSVFDAAWYVRRHPEAASLRRAAPVQSLVSMPPAALV